MAKAGSLEYDTRINTSGYEKGLNEIAGETESGFTQIKNIVAALGIDKIVSKAFDTLSSSVDTAMKRIDTMDQFTRVMTVMTGSAEKAEKALADIKTTVTGTAYGLDTAAMSTQKFVTSGMQLDKATQQVKTWADAVAFYGDGTNETFENVTDALSHMVAKGKVEMDQLNRLTDAGIPAVQIYADMVGKSVSEVQDDLSNGVISAEEFMNGLQTAFEQGTSKFGAISGAAQEAGASWTATFDNMKAAVARGMESIIKSIDKALTKNKMPTLREMISNIGKTAEKYLNEISKRMPTILNMLSKLVPLVKIVGAAFLSWQIGKIAQSTVTSIMNITKATKALFSVMSTNPIALVTASIVGLIAVAAMFQKNVSDEIREIQKQNDEINKNIKARKEMQETISKNITGGLSELTYYQNLYNELTRITDENGRVKEGYEDRAKFITGTLSEAMGMEINLVDGTIQNYQELTSTFEDVIAKKKGMIILNAQEEAYTEAIKKQKEAEETLGKATADLAKKKEELKNREREYQELLKDPNATKAELANAQGRIISKQKEIEETKKLQDKAKENLAQYNYDIASYEDNQAKFQAGKYNEMIYQTYNYVNEKQKADTTELDNLKQKLLAEQEQLDLLKENKKKYNTDIYDNQIKSSEEQIKQLEESIQAQGVKIDEGNRTLTDKWIAGIQTRLQEITGKNYEFRDVGNGNFQMYIDGIKSGQPMAEEDIEKFTNNLAKKVDKPGEFEKSGENIIDGINKGLSNKQKQNNAVGSLVKFATGLVASFNKVLDIHSPSRVFEKWAKFIPEGVAEGIENGTDVALEAIENMDNEMVDKVKEAVSLETGNINAKATLQSSVSNNSVIQINAQFDGDVEMDKNKVGRIVTPVVTKTIKVGGIR